MKKLLAVGCALAIAMSVTACSGGDNSKVPSSTPSRASSESKADRDSADDNEDASAMEQEGLGDEASGDIDEPQTDDNGAVQNAEITSELHPIPAATEDAFTIQSLIEGGGLSRTDIVGAEVTKTPDGETMEVSDSALLDNLWALLAADLEKPAELNTATDKTVEIILYLANGNRVDLLLGGTVSINGEELYQLKDTAMEEQYYSFYDQLVS